MKNISCIENKLFFRQWRLKSVFFFLLAGTIDDRIDRIIQNIQLWFLPHSRILDENEMCRVLQIQRFYYIHIHIVLRLCIIVGRKYTEIIWNEIIQSNVRFNRFNAFFSTWQNTPGFHSIQFGLKQNVKNSTRYEAIGLFSIENDLRCYVCVERSQQLTHGLYRVWHSLLLFLFLLLLVSLYKAHNDNLLTNLSLSISFGYSTSNSHVRLLSMAHNQDRWIRWTVVGCVSGRFAYGSTLLTIFHQINKTDNLLSTWYCPFARILLLCWPIRFIMFTFLYISIYINWYAYIWQIIQIKWSVFKSHSFKLKWITTETGLKIEIKISLKKKIIVNNISIAF